MKYENLKIEKYNHCITRIIDTDVYMYLVEGEEKACLIDCGHGVGDSLFELISSITTKPVFVVLTHNHEDHICGCGWFDEVYIHPKDIAGYESLSSVDERFKRHQNARFAKYPIESYAPPFKKPKYLYDGQVFDLGGVTLKIIECSGHTSGSVVVLIPEERIMIYGDAIGRRVSLIRPGLTVSNYLKSLKHVKEFDGQYDIGLRCHNEILVPIDTVDQLIEASQLILSKKDAHQEICFNHVDGSFTLCYAAFKVKGSKQQREDGKVGNIFYILENAQ